MSCSTFRAALSCLSHHSNAEDLATVMSSVFTHSVFPDYPEKVIFSINTLCQNWLVHTAVISQVFCISIHLLKNTSRTHMKQLNTLQVTMHDQHCVYWFSRGFASLVDMQALSCNHEQLVQSTCNSLKSTETRIWLRGTEVFMRSKVLKICIKTITREVNNEHQSTYKIDFEWGHTMLLGYLNPHVSDN